MASKKGTWHEYSTDLYPVSLFIGVGPIVEEMSETFTYANGEELDSLSPYALAVTVDAIKKDTEERCVVIGFRNKKFAAPSTITHEAYHATTFICDILGIEDSRLGKNEPQAYLIGWIVKCCNNALQAKD